MWRQGCGSSDYQLCHIAAPEAHQTICCYLRMFSDNRTQGFAWWAVRYIEEQQNCQTVRWGLAQGNMVFKVCQWKVVSEAVGIICLE